MHRSWLLGLVVSGCAGSEPSPSVAATNACGAYFDASLDAANRCDNGESATIDLRASVRSGFVAECAFDVELPGAPSDYASRLDQCATLLRAVDCGSLAEHSPCSALLEDVRGSRAAGADCESDAQCRSGACNRQTGCGLCAEERTLGEACSQYQGLACASGLICESTTSGNCEARKTQDEPCQPAALDCATGLACEAGRCTDQLPQVNAVCTNVCAGLLLCVDGTCRARPDEGEPCPDFRCAPGLECDGESHTCENEEAPFAQLGAPCGDTDDCLEGQCRAGVCTAYASLGDTCSASGTIAGAVACAPGLRCEASTCAAPSPICAY